MRSTLLRRNTTHQRDRRTHGVRRDVQGDTALLRQTRLGIDAHRTRRWLGPGGARLMTTLLYGFRPDYIPTVTVVSLILLALATLAWFVPARRASRVAPMIALRKASGRATPDVL